MVNMNGSFNVVIRKICQAPKKIALETKNQGGKLIARVPEELAHDGKRYIENLDVVEIRKAQQELAQRVTKSGGKVLQDEIVFDAGGWNTWSGLYLPWCRPTNRLVTIQTPKGTIVHKLYESNYLNGKLDTLSVKEVIKPDGIVYNSCYRKKGAINKPSHITIGSHEVYKNHPRYGTRYPDRMENYNKNPFAVSGVNTRTGETVSVDPHPFSWSAINRWDSETGTFIQNKKREFPPLGKCSYKEYNDVMWPKLHTNLDDLAHEIGLDTSKL